MDLENNHFFAIALNFRGLSILRLQSCCLVTGEGLKALGEAMNNGLQELALINCDVVEREKGLLATLGQQLRQLRKLDLSYNEMSCKRLENVDIMQCLGIESEAIEMFVKNCSCLRRLEVEGTKVTDAAKMWASNKFVELVV
ncbi:hypothetical protein P8452_64152 [Trifolium repens]|nr:hypothetical protein P8452_64152 [Trifolium repens]